MLDSKTVFEVASCWGNGKAEGSAKRRDFRRRFAVGDNLAVAMGSIGDTCNFSMLSLRCGVSLRKVDCTMHAKPSTVSGSA